MIVLYKLLFGGIVMIISFEEITKDTIYIAQEIINSNKQYNLLENGLDFRTIEEVESDLLNGKSSSNFIKLDDTYIGVIDFLLENPKDHFPWLGLLMIHKDYQGFGFGVKAFQLFEADFLTRGLEFVRIGVIKDNTKAHIFWKSLGFTMFKTTLGQYGNEIFCYEKHLSKKTS